MATQLLIAVAAGAVSAAVALAFLAGVPAGLLLIYLAPLPLMLAGLGLGTAAGTVAGGVGALMAGVMGGVAVGSIYVVIHALPAWLVTSRALKSAMRPDGTAAWYPPGHILSLLASLGGGLFAAVSVLAWASGVGIAELTSNQLDQALAMVVPSLDGSDRSRLVQNLVPLFPGAVGASWIMMAVVNAALAQAILVRMGRALRPSPALTDLDLPDWASWALVAMAAVALLGPGELGYIGRNLTMVMAVPFFFLGLAVIHTLVRRVSFPGTLLVMFYLMLIVSAWAAGAVAGLGMIEQWFGLRRRLATGRGDEENERWK